MKLSKLSILEKKKALMVLVISLLVASFVATAYTVGAQAEDDLTENDVPAEFEMFVDLMGDVNWTQYPDGSQYESYPLSLSSVTTQAVQRGTISFALSIGAFNVVYYKNADGSIPTTIEELYASDIQTFSLYSIDREDKTARSPLDIEISPDIDLGLSQVQDYTGGANNLTVDTLDVGETSEVFTFSDMIANTTEAHLSSSVIADTQEAKYKSYASAVTSWSKSSELLYEPDEADEPKLETYGTTNMTKTVYTWLARLIEVEKGFDLNTVDIDDTTETITSEAVTVQYDQDAYDAIREIIDEELIAAGVTDLAGIKLGSIGGKISKSVTKRTGSFSFSRGLSMPTLYNPAPLIRRSASSLGAAGGRVLKPIVKSVMAPVRSTGLAIDKYVQKGSSGLTNWMTTSANKLKGGPFAFLGGIIKFLAKTVSFLLRYWWLWLLLIGAFLLLTMTPVGPFLMKNTVRKVWKGKR